MQEVETIVVGGEAIDARLRAVEKIVKAQREAFEGESVVGRYAAKEVEAIKRKI